MKKRTWLLVVVTLVAVSMETQVVRATEGSVRLTAEILSPGVVCPRAKLATGEEISLTGFDRKLAPGIKVELEGRFVRFSVCQQGRTFDVSSFVVTAEP